jgi:hypothetical protein
MSSISLSSSWFPSVALLWVAAALAFVAERFVGRRKATMPENLDNKDEKPDWDTLDFSNTEPVSPNFEWSTTEVKPYRPWHDGPYYVTMGEEIPNRSS